MLHEKYCVRNVEVIILPKMSVYFQARVTYKIAPLATLAPARCPRPRGLHNSLMRRVQNDTHIYVHCKVPSCSKIRVQICIPTKQHRDREMSHLNQEKKRHLQRYHPEVYEDIFPKKAKEIPAALGMALAGAGLTTAAEIVARAKELAAAAELRELWMKKRRRKRETHSWGSGGCGGRRGGKQ